MDDPKLEAKLMTDEPVQALVSRRLFLTGASVALAATQLGPLAKTARAQTPATAPTRLSVGYVVGSDRAASLVDLHWIDGDASRVVPHLSARGEAVTGRARVTIHGFYPSRIGEPSAERAVYVDLVLSDPARGRKFPVYLWTHRPGSVASTSGRSRMRLPGRRGFRVALTSFDEMERHSAMSAFGIDGLRPRRGVYLLGLTPGVWKRATTITHGSIDARYDSVLMTIDEAD